jgi:ADP-ribosylglycohydrolase
MMLSLQGLSIGDAFGECFFHPDNAKQIHERILPEGYWIWTDDTHQALSVVENLLRFHEINQDGLAKSLAQRYSLDPGRGYGRGAAGLFDRINNGENWKDLTSSLFEGGSYGNGAAMRVAPIGAYFEGQPEIASYQAKKSAEVSHSHSEGIAGAIAIAVATSIISQVDIVGNVFLNNVLEYLPSSETKRRIELATTIPKNDFDKAVNLLGTGNQIAAYDTVPFCLWIAANFGDNYENALWATVSGLGDRDTTCAIVGGMVSMISEIPISWFERREKLPFLQS